MRVEQPHSLRTQEDPLVEVRLDAPGQHGPHHYVEVGAIDGRHRIRDSVHGVSLRMARRVAFKKYDPRTGRDVRMDELVFTKLIGERRGEQGHPERLVDDGETATR